MRPRAYAPLRAWFIPKPQGLTDGNDADTGIESHGSSTNGGDPSTRRKREEKPCSRTDL